MAASSSPPPKEEGLGELIPIINKLQDVFTTVGPDAPPLSLPQICVVGAQSSGKSSVLEHIVGRDFLPRGSGIVTRRPLVLQLIQISSSESSEWGEFLHLPGQKFSNFAKIREEIAKETDRLTGTNKGISAQPINLKIFSPYVLNLTLVDLPGIARVPVGDQPRDIETQIKAMIYQYAKQPNALILAVSPANADLATSDAIQLARQVDPDGSRTLGVLTKLDIMDKGTSAVDILNNNVVPLKLGYVGIVNRCQEDIAANVSIREALKKEATFFSNHPAYRHIASRCGTAYLSKTLNARLLSHIRATLPDLRSQVSLLAAETQREMTELGDPLLEDQHGALLLSILTKYSRDYGDYIDGKNQYLATHELVGGARINYIFHEMFGRTLDSFDPLNQITPSQIRTAIRNATGTRTALFIPEDSFELLVKRQIQTLEEPSLNCVDQIFDELQRIVTQIEESELNRFTHLRDRIYEVMNGLLAKCRGPTKKMISDLIEMELAYVNTSHPDFVGGSGAITAILQNLAGDRPPGEVPSSSSAGAAPRGPATPGPSRPAQPPALAAPVPRTSPPPSSGGFFFDSSPSSSSARGSPSSRPLGGRTEMGDVPSTIRTAPPTNDKEVFEANLIQKLMVSYFDIVRKNIKDLVPKTCMFFLVAESKRRAQSELISQLYRPDLFSELLEESPGVAERRKDCAKRLEALRKANYVLNEVRDSPIGMRF